jgi:hypothetical protein
MGLNFILPEPMKNIACVGQIINKIIKLDKRKSPYDVLKIAKKNMKPNFGL